LPRRPGFGDVLLEHGSHLAPVTSHLNVLPAEVQDRECLLLLVEAAKECAVFLLDAEGRIASWNEGAQALKGYQAAEIIGEHFSILYTTEDREHGKPARALQIAAAQGRFEEEGWRTRKDGTRFWAQVVVTP
jgi:PAS domain S-box-containing protein